MAGDLSDFVTNPANAIGARTEQDDLSKFVTNPNNVVGVATEGPRFNRDTIPLPGRAPSTTPIETADIQNARDLQSLGQETWGEDRFVNIPASRKGKILNGTTVSDTAIPGTGEQANITRMDIGMSSSPETKRAKFLNKYPEGDFTRLPSGRYAFKRTKDAPWSLYSEDLTQDMPGFSAVVSENLPDFAVGALGGATTKIGKAFGIGAAARLGINTADRARGYNEQGMLAEVTDALGDGAANALGTAIGNFVVSATNVTTARGAAKITDKEKELIAWARKNNMPHLLPSQLHTFESGVVNRLSSFAKNLGSSIDDHLVEQGDNVIRMLAEMRGMNIKSIDTPPVFGQYLRTFKGELERLIVNGEKVGWNDGGKAIQELIDVYQEHAQKAINLKYERLNDLAGGGLQFDVSAARKMADDFARGVTFRVDPAKTSAGKPVKDLKVANSIIETNRQNFEAGGLRGMSETNPVYEAIQTLRLMDDRVGMTVSKTGNVFNGYEQIDHIIDSLQKYLYSGSKENPITTRTERSIKQIITSLQESLGRPTYMDGTGKSFDRAAKDVDFKAFGELLDEAKSMSQDKYKLLDRTKILNLYNTEEPARVARQLASAYNEESLTALQTMAKEVYRFSMEERGMFKGIDLLNEFRNAFRTGLLENTDKMKKVLDGMDAGTLNILVPEAAERRKLYDIAGIFDVLKSSEIQEQLAAQTTATGQIMSLVEMAQKRGIHSDILFEITGGADTEAGKAIKAGIVQNLFDKITEYKNRSWVIQHRGDIETQIFTHFQNLKETGLDRYFSAKELADIEHLAYYAGKTIGNADAGTSLVAAQVAAGASHLNPSKIAELYKYKAAGWFLTSKGVAAFTQGAPESKLFGLVGGKQLENSPILDSLIAGLTAATTDSARSTNAVLSVADKLQAKLQALGVDIGGK